METFGQRIRKLRESLGMTQQDLAKRMNISREAISKWESGESQNIKLDNLMLLCKILRITAEELITGKPPKKTDSLTPGIQPVSDVKRTLMEHINKLDDERLTLAIVPIIQEIMEIAPEKMRLLQSTVHILYEESAEYHVTPRKSKANGE